MEGRGHRLNGFGWPLQRNCCFGEYKLTGLSLQRRIPDNTNRRACTFWVAVPHLQFDPSGGKSLEEFKIIRTKCRAHATFYCMQTSHIPIFHDAINTGMIYALFAAAIVFRAFKSTRSHWWGYGPSPPVCLQ